MTHSFPTRRSADLISRLYFRAHQTAEELFLALHKLVPQSGRCHSGVHGNDGRTAGSPWPRPYEALGTRGRYSAFSTVHPPAPGPVPIAGTGEVVRPPCRGGERSEERRVGQDVSVPVEIGGRGNLKKTKN